MSYYTNPKANLIDTSTFQTALKEKMNAGSRIYQIEGRNSEGDIWFQVITKKKPLEFWNDITNTSNSLFFDKYHSHPKEKIRIVAQPINDINEVHTGNLYEVN